MGKLASLVGEMSHVLGLPEQKGPVPLFSVLQHTTIEFWGFSRGG